jgi:hypothetical protein
MTAVESISFMTLEAKDLSNCLRFGEGSGFTIIGVDFHKASKIIIMKAPILHKLVFVHGSDEIDKVWHYQLEYFGDSDALSLPGHPHSAPCNSVGQYADCVRQRG